jgi:hypothetical protein
VLLEQNVEVPLYISYILCSLFLIAALFYPSRKQKHAYKNFYGFRKTMDGVLFSLSFLLIVLTMNASSSGKLLFGGGNAWAAESAIKPVKPFYKVKVQAKGAAFIIKHWKSLKSNYKLLRQAYRDTTKGEKAALIVLASIVALALWMLVLSLSCTLSCAGAEGAALVVALLGTGLIVFVLVKVIQGINRGQKKPKPVEERTGQL